MKRFLLHGGIRRGVIVTLGCELLFLGIIAAVVTYQVRMVETKITEMADLKDPSPFTARLVGYLNKTNMNLLSYIQNRDDAALQQIAESQKDFENSIVEFQKLNPRLFPATSQSGILNAYQPFKDALRDILRAGDAESEKWTDLLDNNDRVVYLLEHRLRPIIRMDQRKALPRLDLVLNLENVARNIPKDMTESIFRHSGQAEARLAQNDRKFEKLLQIY